MSKNILNISLDFFKNNNNFYKSWIEEINDEICVWKKNSNTYFAYSNICPHNGGEFKQPINDKIKCKWHGWEFDINNGKCVTFETLNCKINIYESVVNGNHLSVKYKS